MSWRREVDLATGPENGVHTNQELSWPSVHKRSIIIHGEPTPLRGPGPIGPGNAIFVHPAIDLLRGRCLVYVRSELTPIPKLTRTVHDCKLRWRGFFWASRPFIH